MAGLWCGRGVGRGGGSGVGGGARGRGQVSLLSQSGRPWLGLTVWRSLHDLQDKVDR